MDSDVELNHLERPPGDGDDNDDSDSGNEYDLNDDGAADALLAPSTQTRGQNKQPASRAAATLWNQVGGVVVEVRVSALSFPLIANPETPGITDALIHHHRPPIHWRAIRQDICMAPLFLFLLFF